MVTLPYRLDLGAGDFVIGDELPGERPYYVFLHGLGSVRAGEKSESLFQHARSRGHGSLRFDLRGHGESSGRIGNVAISELVADTQRVLEHTGPAYLVGSSLGGLVSALVAAEQPNSVARLALLAPAFGLLRNLAAFVDASGMMSTNDGPRFEVAPRVLDDALQVDERNLPRRINVPTIIAHGTADDVIPHQVSEQFFGELASASKQLWLVPNGDHRLNTVATEIWRRLDELSST